MNAPHPVTVHLDDVEMFDPIAAEAERGIAELEAFLAEQDVCVEREALVYA